MSRFANYVYLVLEGFVENYPALIKSIVEVQEEGSLEGATDNQKKKADKCAGLQIQIYSLLFGLTLCGLCDIYSHYSKSVNVLQIVNILPHEKHDMFQKGCRDKLKEMMLNLDPVDCGCELPDTEVTSQEGSMQEREAGVTQGEQDGQEGVGEDEGGRETDVAGGGVKNAEEVECKWPLLHKHMLEWRDQKRFRGVDMGYLESDQRRPNLRSGTQEEQEAYEDKENRTMQMMLQRCRQVVEYVYNGLGEVYSPEDLEMIKHIRNVLDLKAMMKLVKTKGPVQAGQKTTQQFFESAEFIDPEIRTRCDRLEMRAQHQEFLRRIEEITEVKDSDKLSSMEVMVMLLNTEAKRFQGCEAVIDILCQAAAMKSVESVVESWISVLEHHSNKSRNLKGETVETEMQIAINGPKIQHCEKVVEESMAAYWRKMKRSTLQQGHFTRRSSQIKSYFVSKTVDNLRKQPEKSQLMM